MKALILAAGLGTRLAPITNDIPKSMVPVNGCPILMKQINNLHENGIEDITVISGYKGEIIESAIREKFPEIQVIRNTDFSTTNNMYSAYLAKEKLEGEAFLMMNADVFYDSSVIKALMDDPNDNAIVTDIGRYLEESMKVSEKDGRLVSISKAITQEEALGASIDVYKFSSEGGKAFFEKCAEYIEDKKELNMWSEVALNEILEDIVFKACPLVGRWVEIDNHDDLAEAERLFAE